MAANPGHEASADDRGDAKKGRVPPSTMTVEEKEARNGDHYRHSRERLRKKRSTTEEPRREFNHTARRRPARTSIGTVKIEAGGKKMKSSSASAKYGGGGKDTSPRVSGSSEPW